MKAAFWGAVAGLTLMGATPAWAIDLNGKAIVIDIVYHPHGLQPFNGQVLIRGVAGLLQWGASAPPACSVNGRPVEISLVYGPQPNRTDKIACDPTQTGTASKNENSTGAGTFTTSYSNNGDVVALSGQMEFRSVTRYFETGPTAESSTYTRTYQIRQALSLRIAGNNCEVLNFLDETTEHKTSQTVAGPGRNPLVPLVPDTPTTGTTRKTVPNRSKCTVMPIGDYQGRLSGARRSN